MCGRINIIDDDGIRGFLASLGLNENLATRYNIAPTENIPVVTNSSNGLAIHNMRWWLNPSWAGEISTRFSMFNARSETIESSKAFRGPFHTRRGVVPISSFIEWKSEEKGKQPYLISTENKFMALAAVWDVWQKDDYYLESCAILTTEAKATFSGIHSRMPVILSAMNISLWLDKTTKAEDLKKLFAPAQSPPLTACTISKIINNARNKDDRAVCPTGEMLAIK